MVLPSAVMKTSILTQERIDHFSSHTPITTSFHGSISSDPTITEIKGILHDVNVFTITLQPPTHGLSIVMLVHASIVVDIMVLIILWNRMTKPALCRTKQRFKRRGLVDQVVVEVMEDVLVMATIIKTMETMTGKIGMTNTSIVSSGGVDCFDGIWMSYYNKCNTCSGTPYAHTTIFHDVALLAGTSHHLPSTHPFHHHCSTTNNSIGTSAPFWIPQLWFQGGYCYK